VWIWEVEALVWLCLPGYCEFFRLAQKSAFKSYGSFSGFGEAWHAWVKNDEWTNDEWAESGERVQFYFWVGQPMSKRPAKIEGVWLLEK